MTDGAEGEGVIPIAIRRATDRALPPGAVQIRVGAIDRHRADVGALALGGRLAAGAGRLALTGGGLATGAGLTLTLLALLAPAPPGGGIFAQQEGAPGDGGEGGGEEAAQGGAASQGGVDGAGEGVEGLGIRW